MAYMISSRTINGFMEAVNRAVMKGDTLVRMYLSPDRRFYVAEMEHPALPKKRRSR